VNRGRNTCIGFRSLSDLGLIDFGKAGFGQIFRSFSLNSYGYSPQTIEKSASNWLSLASKSPKSDKLLDWFQFF
jgi:hypothetical protein